ncbi:MAG: Holliday junction resolvase RuvX [Candidatus Moranbacteria bacterium CG06_land_8_20_14_3_00_40_12]|nr:MAG: Holliday junction resolvase RuvX [Candidatus Moranbacteria bacterium CG23_combo_of_CG06-09_8_20_14_all_40_16]PIU80881.1 MAG: Holliday junction resolvase RuvX [Candidatus Moranbacteria bacterium CG06_land_8_20_14_3_00_40_12]
MNQVFPSYWIENVGKRNLAQIKTILAIDYGKSKVGLALGDNLVRIAFAYKTLPNNKNFWEILAKIIAKEEIKKVIIGRPGHNNFKDSAEAGAIKKLGEKIATELKLPVEYQEEMFTTRMARNNLKEKGLKNLERYDDQESARIILESWFASQDF